MDEWDELNSSERKNMRNAKLRGARGGWAALVGGTCLMAAGCGDVATSGAGEEITLTTSYITNTDAVDATGQITIRVKTCDYPASAQAAQTVTCPVDLAQGFALVGGGAEVQGESTPGALLQASYPDLGDHSRWTATSRRYTGNGSHFLRAYSIGMKLSGMTSAETAGNLFFVDGTDGFQSSTVEYNQTLASYGPDVKLLGGGGLVLPPGTLAKMFLNESRPDPATRGWITGADNNGSGDTAQVKSVVIGIKPCPVRGNGTTWGCVTTSLFSHQDTAPDGYKTSSASVGSGFVVSSVGGVTNVDRVRRYLADLIPRTTSGSQGVTLRTTTTVNSGITGFQETDMMGIRKN
jgi:hypothetical protein